MLLLRESYREKMTYRVGLHTLGCKVSQYETEAMGEEFVRRGFVRVPFEETADVYVINTCTVTAESDRKSRQMIRRAVRQNPDAVVMVVGCFSETSPEEAMRIPGVRYVAGSEGKMRVPQRALELLKEQEEGKSLSPMCEKLPLVGAVFEPMRVDTAPRTRAYVKIEDGCECRCTYCAIPGARGNVRSKRPEDVLEEVEGLCRQGTEEVVLTGIETASYGAEFAGFRLIDLLEMLEEKSSVSRIRLGSLTPEVMREDFVRRIGQLSKIAPHFHLSVQSGSDAVLAGMKRRYRAAFALEAMERLRAALPRVEFTTDMMVGFPGETEENFEETLAFSEKAAFLAMHVFAYSKRKGTPAALYPNQVPEDVKRERSSRLIALGERMRQKRLLAMIERKEPLHVLFEARHGNRFYGHSDEFAEVALETGEDLHGRFLTVMPKREENGILLCTTL